MKRPQGASVVHVPGVKRFLKGGEWYAYHRASGTRLKQAFGSAAFFVELERAQRKHAKQETNIVPGTLGALFQEYRASPKFRRLAPRSRLDYNKVLDSLKPIEDWPLATIDPPAIAKLRDEVFEKRKRRFANYTIAVLASAFALGRERGLIKENPALGIEIIPRPRDMPKANRPWSEDECTAVLDAAPAYLKIPIALGMFCGMREGDVIRLPRNARQADGWLIYRTGKAGTEVPLRVHPELARVLDASPADSVTMCVNSLGRPWKNENAFRKGFFALLAKLEMRGLVKPGLTFHGLRHTVGALLKEAGFSDEDIAVALGHKTTRMARHYSEGASRKRRTSAMVHELNPLARKRGADEPKR